MATHDIELVAACADRTIVLEQGAVVEEGTPGAVILQRDAYASGAAPLPRRAPPTVEGVWRNQWRCAAHCSTRASLIAASVLGGALAALPLPATAGRPAAPSAHATDAPLVFLALIVLCLGAVAANLTAGETRRIIMLGVLTAMNAVMRAIPPGGSAPSSSCDPLRLCLWRARFGFLLGSLSLMVSALDCGGRTLATLSDALRRLVGMKISGWLPRFGDRRLELANCRLGVLSGLVFGAVMNLWFYPFISVPSGQDIYWQPGLGLLQGLRRYLVVAALVGRDANRRQRVLLLLFGGPCSSPCATSSGGSISRCRRGRADHAARKVEPPAPATGRRLRACGPSDVRCADA